MWLVRTATGVFYIASSSLNIVDLSLNDSVVSQLENCRDIVNELFPAATS